MVLKHDIAENNKNGLSYFMLTNRLPIIITRLIDCLWRKRHTLEPLNLAIESGINSEQEISDALKCYLEKLPQIKNEMITDKPMANLEDERLNGISLTPEAANVSKDHFRWFKVPYLLSETYLYTKLYFLAQNIDIPCFEQFDPFLLFKKEAFEFYMKNVSQLCHELSHCKADQDEVNTKKNLYKFAFLSICAENSDAHFFKDESEVIFSDLKSDYNIFVDKFDELYEYMFEAIVEADRDERPVKIAVVLNYGGYDLFVTLCLMELITSKFFDENYDCSIEFYTQPCPMFLHCTEDDFTAMLAYRSEQEHIQRIFDIFNQRINDSKWTISGRYPFFYTRRTNQTFKDYDLCVFKGDYNYRTLAAGMIADDSGTTLAEALPKSLECKALCTMRVIKSDIIFDFNDNELYSMTDMKRDFKAKNANCLDLNFVNLGSDHRKEA